MWFYVFIIIIVIIVIYAFILYNSFVKLNNKVIGITLAVLLLFGACTLSKDMALRVAMLTTSPSKAFAMIYKDAGKDVKGNSIYTVDAGKKSEKTFIVYKHGPLYFAKGV